MFHQSYSLSSDTPCFSCDGSESSSYLKSGYFQKFLYSELTIQNDIEFLCKGVDVSASLLKNFQYVFKEIKKNFFMVKSAAFVNSIDVEAVRMGIVKMFHFLSANLQALNARQINDDLNISFKENNIKQLITEIKNMLLQVQRISSISSIHKAKNFTNNNSKSATISYHYYHLCLDVWYNCASLLYDIYFLNLADVDEIFCDFIPTDCSPFSQLAHFLIYELSYLAISNYKSSYKISNSAFLCPCIREFWILLIKLIDKFSIHIERFSFWNVYQSNLQTILASITSQSVEHDPCSQTLSLIENVSNIQNPIEVFFWLTSHIAPLYKYDDMGYICEHNKVKSGYNVGKYLVHNLLLAPDSKEKVLRISLFYCIELQKLWEPSDVMLLPMTDLFMRKIEETFNVEEIVLSYLFKDAVVWFTHIRTLSKFVSMNNKTSFDQFLCILHSQLSRDMNNCSWRSIKGRIYSKLTHKKIKEMSEVGLQNLFSLFLVIASSGQLEVVNKIYEMASITETVQNHRRHMISWKALFVLLYIFLEEKLDPEKITSILSNFFNAICSDYCKIKMDCLLKSNLMKLLLVYIDNMGELLKKNDYQNLFAYQLLSKGFSDLLPVCDVTERNYILSVIRSILQKISQSTKADYVTSDTQYFRTLQSILNNVYPYIEILAISDTAPLAISDIAANLTKLTFDFSSLINDASCDFLKIFRYFAFKETVKCDVTCQYLFFILDNPILCDEIKLRLSDPDVLIFQSWIRCIICIPTGNDCIQKLTERVLQQHAVTQLHSGVSLAFEESDHVNLTGKFFEQVGSAFSKCSQEERVRMARRMQQYFRNYMTVAVSKIKKDKEGSTFSHVYKLTSLLVEHCSSVLHFKVTSQCILIDILNKTVYPQILFPGDKALQYHVSYSIKDHLPGFMRGLFKLDYQEDKSVEREIRDIFICYITMLSTPKNPLIKMAVDSVSKKPGALTLDAYNFILEVTKQKVVLKSKDKEMPKKVFEFYHEIFKQVPSSCKREISNTLLKCALEVYMKQNDSLTEYLKTLIIKVLVHFRDEIASADSKAILLPIIQWFIEEKLQWAVVRGYFIIDTFIYYLPRVMLDVVPIFTRAVEAIEKNRGIGEDLLLRNGLISSVNKLQKRLKDA